MLYQQDACSARLGGWAHTAEGFAAVDSSTWAFHLIRVLALGERIQVWKFSELCGAHLRLDLLAGFRMG